MYVDDIMVKTRQSEGHVSGLGLAFDRLIANNIKLNPKKCVFGVPGGMLLGFLVSKRGIGGNSKKIATITNIRSISDLKGVQWVMGCLVSLSRFISCLREHRLPLY